MEFAETGQGKHGRQAAVRCLGGRDLCAFALHHEDIGLACPNIITLVHTCCEQAREWYNPDKLGQWRMAVGTAIRAMCRAPKSREGDHFQAAVGLRNQLEGYTPEVPDWTCDQHTARGKALGRGLDYFRTESTKLVPAPAEKDPYEDEAYRLWELKRKGVQPTAANIPVGSNRQPRAKLVTLKAVIGGDDNGDPCITIMYPHED